MPVLKANHETTKLQLPSTENEANEDDRAWVVITNRLMLKDLSEHITSDGNHAVEGVAAAIQDWNYTLEDGTKAPIDVEHVSMMEIEDFNFLSSHLNQRKGAALAGLNLEEKKTSPSTLTQPLTVATPPSS